MSASVDTLRACVGAADLRDYTVAELAQRAKALAVLVDELAVELGTHEVAASDRVDAWSLRGAEVRAQEALRLLQGVGHSLDSLSGRMAARGAS